MPKKTVLVVEDAEATRRLIEMSMIIDGYKVIQREDGESGQESGHGPDFGGDDPPLPDVSDLAPHRLEDLRSEECAQGIGLVSCGEERVELGKSPLGSLDVQGFEGASGRSRPCEGPSIQVDPTHGGLAGRGAGGEAEQQADERAHRGQPFPGGGIVSGTRRIIRDEQGCDNPPPAGPRWNRLTTSS